MTPPRRLTEQQLRMIRAMWDEGASQVEICTALRISADLFKARRHDQLRNLPKRDRSALSARRGYLPTEEEIREACERLQAAWSDEQRRHR
jgi:hypothetical protein